MRKNYLRKQFVLFLGLFITTGLIAQTSISSFYPLAGPPGTTVQINGANFDATASNNIVFFGATRANVTAASASQLTVTVPSGASYQPITVAVNSRIAISAIPFTATHAGGNISFNVSAFAARVDTTTGLAPLSVVAADLDGDGKPDLVSSNQSANTISILRNISPNGSIAFAPKSDLATAVFPYFVASGDMNADGKPDIIVTNNSSNSVSVFLNSSNIGAISFAARQDFTTGAFPKGLAIGDIDGDGLLDICVANSNAANVSVLRNNTTGPTISFAPKVDMAVGSFPYAITVCDVDSDGKPDLAVCNQSTNNISVLKNNSTLNNILFAAKVDFASGNYPQGIASGDLDADGKPDLATNNYIANTVSIFKNTSSGSSISFNKIDSVSGNPLSQSHDISINDLNGDGKPELIISNGFNNQVSIFRNTNTTAGVLAFAARVNYATANNPYNICVNDLDGDGRPELALAVNGTNKVSVYRNIAPPKLNSFSPATGVVGTTVNIDGHNFRVNPAENIVTFGGVKATVTAASNTNLTVTVPVGATYQPLSVTAEKLTGSSTRPFVVNFTGGDTIIANSFAAQQLISTGTLPRDVALADIDGDGENDVVAVFSQAMSFGVCRNASTPGTLALSPITNIAGSYGVAVAAADLTGDGKPEVMYVNGEGSIMTAHTNTSNVGSISFATGTGVSDVTAGKYIATADMNADGMRDVVISNDYSMNVIANTSYNGTLTFGAKPNYTFSQGGSHPLAVADLDGDGRPDIISGSMFRRNTSTNHLFSFDVETSYHNNLFVNALAVGDIDGDGKPDIAVSDSSAKKLILYLNTSSGANISFQKQTEYLTGPGPRKVSITDMNGDGRPDVAIADMQYDVISVYTNISTTGALQFIPKVDYATGKFTQSIVIGDLDGDGKPDLVAGDDWAGKLHVLKYELTGPVPGVPTISSFSPLSGPVGTSITITGTNFNATAANNTVHFGTVKANVTSAGSNSITVEAPAGASYQPITVTTGGYTAYAAKPFNFTFPGGSGPFNASSFDDYRPFGTGTWPGAVAAGDLDGDGKPDMVVTNKDDNTISVFRNTTDTITGIWFSPKTDYPTGYASPKHATMADIDGDGKLDVIVVKTTGNETENSFVVYRNISSIGNISFENPLTFSATVGLLNSNPVFVAAGDLDGDGKTDLAIANYNSGVVSLFRNTSSGASISFAQQVNYELMSGGPTWISIRDMDGNGKPDLVVSIYNTTYAVAVLSNTSNVGAISFSAALRYYVDEPYSKTLATADINGDGKPDIVTENAHSVAVMNNGSIRGTHLFDDKASRAGFFLMQAMAADDLNGDGKPDIVTGDGFNAGVAVYRNTWFTLGDTCGLAAHVKYRSAAMPGSPYYVTTADFDVDGKPDIAVTNISPSTVSILRNRTGEPRLMKLCPPIGGITIMADPAGASFQWQESLDSINFNNINENSNFSGTATASLTLSNIPSSWYGRTYRCVVDGQNSEKFTIRFTNTWTGAVNEAWENPGNWSCGTVPDAYTDVLVENGPITINGNTTIRSIKVMTGVNITVNPGVVFTVLH